MRTTKKKIYLSIVIPVYESMYTLEELYLRLTKSCVQLSKPYEIIFIDDGSSDNSWNVLSKIYEQDKYVRIFRFSRNFGQHNSIMCGLIKSHGKFIITLDDDLQNPPEEIHKLLPKINEGYDVVYGEYISKRHAFFRNVGSNLVQFVYQKVFQVKGNLTSFRIIRDDIAHKICSYKRNYTFIDGLLAWQTKNIGYVIVRHDTRKSGKSNYNLAKLFILTLNMVTNFSIFPLQLSSIVGIIFSFIGLLLTIFYLLKKIFFGIPVTGFTSIMIAILIFSGVQLLTIGLIGEYIGRIHLNINQKPQYIIKCAKERENDTLS